MYNERWIARDMTDEEVGNPRGREVGEGCVYLATRSDIPIRRRGIQIVTVSISGRIVTDDSARYWSAHQTCQTRFINVPSV